VLPPIGVKTKRLLRTVAAVPSSSWSRQYSTFVLVFTHSVYCFATAAGAGGVNKGRGRL